MSLGVMDNFYRKAPDQIGRSMDVSLLGDRSPSPRPSPAGRGRIVACLSAEAWRKTGRKNCLAARDIRRLSPTHEPSRRQLDSQELTKGGFRVTIRAFWDVESLPAGEGEGEGEGDGPATRPAPHWNMASCWAAPDQSGRGLPRSKTLRDLVGSRNSATALGGRSQTLCSA